MKVTIFGATGALGSECLTQALEAGYEVTVLIRSPEKLPKGILDRINVIKGDALLFDDVLRSISKNTEAVLFAIGVDEKTSPQNLCTDVTKNIFRAMRSNKVSRFVWCGGGSNIIKDDVVTFGSKFVRWYAEIFLKHRHSDKELQMRFLEKNTDLNWVGIRPLQMKPGSRTRRYRLGFNAYSGLSKITFADCAHAMIDMLSDDTWLGKSPIIQY